VLLQDVGERFVRQFLDGGHPVAPELLQLFEGLVVEGDQLAHAFAGSCGIRKSRHLKPGKGKWFRSRIRQPSGITTGRAGKPELTAKDALHLRYTFVNEAAESWPACRALAAQNVLPRNLPHRWSLNFKGSFQ
jgi:hypothetical protein